MIKKAALALTLAISVGTTSCLGPNNTYNSLRNWNASGIEADWLAELAYIGMYIIPVYPIAFLGDTLIFNTIEYWSGDNPISDPGPFPTDEFQK